MQVWRRLTQAFRHFPFQFSLLDFSVAWLFFSMRKASTLQCALLRFGVPLLLLVSFCFATSAEVSGNEVNTDGKLVNEGLTKTNLNGHDEEAKFKGFFHPKPIFKKPIPFVKPIPKPVIVKKPIPAVEPEAFLKPEPFFKKPFPKLPHHPKFEKPHHPHFPIHKPIPAVEQESFLKPEPFFKKPFPKLPHHPKFEKPHHPHFPIHKPVQTP